MIKVAILDLNEGYPNQGMRGIRETLQYWFQQHNYEFQLDEFEVRLQQQIPNLSYDVYISSGGPGSPIDSEGTEWENLYFNWIQQVEQWNTQKESFPKKYIFFICHSFQLATRFYNVATVCKRKSTSFGVFPVHMTLAGEKDSVFQDLKNPFYAVDSRDYQIIQPNISRLNAMGGAVLAIEKERPHIPLERAVMAMRFNEYFIGTQFHPEADATGMSMYLQQTDKKRIVIENYGEEKWKHMVAYLQEPDKILFTYNKVLPNFLNIAMQQHNLIAAK